MSGWDAAAGWESVLAIGPYHGFARIDGWMDGWMRGGHGRAEGGLVGGGVLQGRSWCVRSVQRGEKEGESEEDFV